MREAILYSIMGIALIPTIFLYLAFTAVLAAVFNVFKIPFPIFIGLIFSLGLGFGSSYLLNRPIIQEVDKYKNLDMPLNEQFKIPKTIAIYSRQYERHGSACNVLCQLLLYNDAVQRVVIITDPSFVDNDNDKGQGLISYEIEQQSNCNNDSMITGRWGKMAINNVEHRMAKGECLVKKPAKLYDVDVIFFHNEILQNDNYQDFVSLKRRVVFVNYIELLENDDGLFKKMYRFSEITAQPFSSPLKIGFIFAAAGGTPSFGFYHSRIAVNDVGSSGDFIQEFKLQMEMLFGDALKPIDG